MYIFDVAMFTHCHHLFAGCIKEQALFSIINTKAFNAILPLVFSLTVLPLFVQAQAVTKRSKSNFTVSGYVRNKETGENLLGVNVFDRTSGSGTTTNEYGFYSITLPEGKVGLRFSYVGYSVREKELNLVADIKINVELEANKALEEVIVYGKRSETGVNSTQMGAIDLPVEVLKKVPSLLGEADAIKAMQLMPGIQAGTEGSSGIYVRGGGPDENLILLDGVPLYNIDHLFGFFSIFTPESLKKISVYKSSFPARYNGRLSSVIDVRTNDGNVHKYHGTVGIGLLSAKLQLEGPIIKDRTAFNVSARRSYLDLLARPFMDKDDKFSYYFYDVNAKVNHRFNDNHRLYLSFYKGTDNFSTEYKADWDNYQSNDKNNIKWGNTTAALRWNYVVSPVLFSNTTVAYTEYNYRSVAESLQNSSNYRSDSQSGIKDFTYTIDWDYRPSFRHHLKFGISQQGHFFKPETVAGRINGDSNLVEYGNRANSRVRAYESNVYAEDTWELTNRLSTNIGVNFSAYHVQKKTYFSLQPRVSVRYRLTDPLVLKASYTQMNQNIHLLSSYTMVMPTDLWVPATNKIKPMQSHQYSVGAYYTGVADWMFSVEGYYKKTRHVLEYKDGAALMGSSVNWEEKVETGEARSMGVEFMLQKTVGKTTGWLSYTLAKTDRKFPDGTINNGDWFPYRYDRRHHFNLAFNHQLSKKIDLNATWKFHTGGVTTLAEQNSVAVRPDNNVSSSLIDYVGRRNNYRLPGSHCLSLGINFTKPTKYGTRTWNISIYNVYNAMNPTFIFRESKDENGNHQNVLKKVTLLPLIPSVSYIYKF